jgi:hypothetical protein
LQVMKSPFGQSGDRRINIGKGRHQSAHAIGAELFSYIEGSPRNRQAVFDVMRKAGGWSRGYPLQACFPKILLRHAR